MARYKNYFLILLIAAPCFYTSAEISPKQTHLLHYSAQTAAWITTGLLGTTGAVISLLLAKTFLEVVAQIVVEKDYSKQNRRGIKLASVWVGGTACLL
nr:hypothetical protein [Candidatus Dependentiae bacterium]